MQATAGALITLAVVVALAGALGTWLMRDACQKLHYITLPCSISAWLIAAAVLISERQKISGLKVALVALVLFLMNAVVTQATARAGWVRNEGRWPPQKPPPPPPPEGR
jgi:multisubunit Na+/H+ antiporter MnhG subunit